MGYASRYEKTKTRQIVETVAFSKPGKRDKRQIKVNYWMNMDKITAISRKIHPGEKEPKPGPINERKRRKSDRVG
jgi:hypothetical protein